MAPNPVSEWEPVPLELPLDLPVERTPAPADGDPGNDDRRDDDFGRTVIVIDLY